MSVAELTVSNMSLRDIVALVNESVATGDDRVLARVLGELGDLADDAATSGDVRAIALQRDRLNRIARAVRALPDAPTLAAYALGYFDDADRRLDRARTKALGAQAAERREEGAPGVRDTVLALLAEPRRPRDIAEQLRCDPSQVSRALRELQADGLVVGASAPSGAAGDRRAHWYAQAQRQAA